MIDNAINELGDVVSTSAAIAALGESRATWYRRHRQSPLPERPERVATPQPRALSEVERKQIKTTLESEEFIDAAPSADNAKLLDQGV
jgi:putative transposase